ncbi:mannosyl-glycoendo-beta-N-acetylglucosaminidase [Carnobacterium divergens]|uniref:glucosaminidase domain-containing protein n=1 Tax=Carnobacterium divergens TaxID=2748 RepID=UPI000D4D081B|nr:glucosaminidase domain-containing protein [Carnobacterium divergens]MCO6017846.1 LysM peptidoglycan-binding domain-containing protein [Carnobacterium divergens]TFI60743.1 mannosyl-glycoendo-beta-N-acetylglucosaminidase [Carnobacterium divergens]TFI87766.1 mannosyl-glycoendo-beta-N-acetylglucosaminidase [Carnobacterium divergens]TFJ02333.1 mannosyl-glycoendo-beta-N-acetylglucosaminidase [Carnobacterium divergens]TFJ03844.1 mannosyl-glycoendo-beta-N-acetylglucosaminidase [Carnobacterium diver
MKSRKTRILKEKKAQQLKIIKKSSGLLNTSIVVASLALPSFSVLASAEENASASQRAIEEMLDQPNTSKSASSEDVSVSTTDSEQLVEPTEPVAPPVEEQPTEKPQPEPEPVLPPVEVAPPVVETPAPAPKTEVETTRPFTKEEVINQNIVEVQVPEANREKAEKIMFVKNQSTQEFIDKISESASEIGAEQDLYASVMIAQAILESGSGNSSLSSEPNYNLFGIKGTFESDSVAMLTLEDDGSGNYYQITGQFRKYPSYKESLEDYAKLLKGGTSFNETFYAGTWKSKTTSFHEATQFLTGKYATDTRYAEKLDQLIETYDLTQYDDGVVKKSTEKEVDVMHTIAKGDTLWDLANTYDVTVAELMEWNELTSDIIFVNQELIAKKGMATEVVVEPTGNTLNGDSTNVATDEQPSKFQQIQQGSLAFDEAASSVSIAQSSKATTTIHYQVAEGDSLHSIALKHHVSPIEIKKWNGMKQNLLYIGQQLTIQSV